MKNRKYCQTKLEKNSLSHKKAWIRSQIQICIRIRILKKELDPDPDRSRVYRYTIYSSEALFTSIRDNYVLGAKCEDHGDQLIADPRGSRPLLWYVFLIWKATRAYLKDSFSIADLKQQFLSRILHVLARLFVITDLKFLDRFGSGSGKDPNSDTDPFPIRISVETFLKLHTHRLNLS